MAIEVHPDHPDGNSLRRNNKGFSAKVIYKVSELSLPASALAQVKEAIEDPGTPDYFSEHPDESTIVVLDIDGVVESPGNVKLTYTYAPPNWQDKDEPDDQDVDSVEIDISSALQQVQTQKNNVGADLEVTHNGKSMVGTVSVGRPQHVISFARVEETHARDKAQLYVGKINDILYQGYEAQSLLCTAINSKKISDGRYNVIYQFLYDEKLHRQDVWWIDNATGFPPAGLVFEAGWDTFVMYFAENFSQLGLPII